MGAREPHGGAGTVGVVGARGGAGATVLAALLAARLARRGPAVLVDGGAGPSLDTVLGLEEHPGLRWPDLTGARGVVDPALLAGNLMQWDRCGVLPTDDTRPGPPPPGVVPDVLDALAVGHRSVVLDLDRSAVIAVGAGRAPDDGADARDVPAGPGAVPGAAATQVLVAACRTVLVVAPRDVPGVAGARVLRDVLVGDGRRVGLVARGPAPGGLAAEELAEAVGLPLVASLPRARGLAGSVDHGAGPVAPPGVARVVARLAARLAGPAA